jgi:hexokinase
MADVPKDLMQEIKRLEEMFAVDTAKLKSITEHFVKELAKGETVSYLESYLLTFIRFEC